jgi:hypothetical protein
MTGLCAPDLFHANMVAREMVLSAGMGRKIGECDMLYNTSFTLHCHYGCTANSGGVATGGCSSNRIWDMTQCRSRSCTGYVYSKIMRA